MGTWAHQYITVKRYDYEDGGRLARLLSEGWLVWSANTSVDGTTTFDLCRAL